MLEAMTQSGVATQDDKIGQAEATKKTFPTQRSGQVMMQCLSPPMLSRRIDKEGAVVETLQQSGENIEKVLDEAKKMMALSLSQYESQVNKLRSQLRRQKQENASLRKERDATQQKLVKSEEQNAQLEERVSSLRTLRDLAFQHVKQGCCEVAVPLCKQTLEDLERTSGHDHPDVATMQSILAQVYGDQGKYNEAAALFNDALAIREKTLGPDHLDVATSLNDLAELHGNRGNFAEAELLCKRALAIVERELGSEPSDVAEQLNRLALLCQNQGKYGEMEFYCQRELEIDISQLGEDDPYVCNTKNLLASAYWNQGKYLQAEQLYKEVLDTAHKLDYNASMTIWQQAEEEETKSRGPVEHSSACRLDNQTVSTTVNNLAALYRFQGRKIAAEKLENWLHGR